MGWKDTVVYSLSVEDIQTVAKEEFGRKLTRPEIELVEHKLGDYIAWYDLVEMTILDTLRLEKRDSPD